MAIVQTGSILTFTGLGTANTGTVSTTITVPSDADIVVVGWSGFSTTANFFSGGSMTFTKGGADTAMTMVAGSDTANWSGGMAYLALPDTGSNKTLKWDWIGAGTSSDPSTMCCVTFWKGIDTASPVRGTGFGSAGTQPYTTGTITAASGDLFVAWCPFFSSLEDTINTWTGLSTLAQQTLSGNADAAWATGSPSGNAAVAALTRTIGGDGALFCISLKPSSATASVEGSKSKTIFIPRQGPTKGLRQTQAFAPAVPAPPDFSGSKSKTIFIPGRGPTLGLKRSDAYPSSIASAAGAGSAAGTGAATAVGASTAASVGAAAGTGAATAVGASTAASVGSAAGVGAATAVGSGTAASVGSAAGTGAATGVGASTAAAVGSAAGTGAATGPDVSTAASVGTSAGIGAATAIGASTAAAVGSAAGTGSATAISLTGLGPQVGMSQGFLFHPGRGPSWDIIKRSAFPTDVLVAPFGTAAGIGSATAVGASTAASVGSAAGTGAAAGIGASTVAAVGSAAGTGSATAIGASTASSIGAATGIGTATATGLTTGAATANAAGVGAAAAVGASTAAAVGSASGVGSATGVGAAQGTVTGDGLAQGVGTATAFSNSIVSAVGLAIGIGSASATSGSGTPNYGRNRHGGDGKYRGWRPLKKKKLTELEELEELEELLEAAALVAPKPISKPLKVYQGPLAAIFTEPIEPRTSPQVREIISRAKAEAQRMENDDEEALLFLLFS